MHREQHSLGSDGILDDGVGHDAAGAESLAQFNLAQDSLAAMPVPHLDRAGDSLSRLFMAAFDGTGNDAFGDPLHATNIGRIWDQVAAAHEAGLTDIQMHYAPGVGTQEQPITRALDLAYGFSYEERLDVAYFAFVRQAKTWLRENPDAQISIASIGFSRGAEQAASFTRLVHERGIQDPDNARRVRGPDGRLTIEYVGEPLVPPGQVAQVVGLLDPVGTGEPRNHDRRLPPSVISGLQITAGDERRGLFKSTQIIDTGITADGRFLGVMVPGAHSNVGGGYHRDGLSDRSANLLIDYLNALSDTPFLRRERVVDDPRLDVVHRSHEGMLLYRLWNKVDRNKADGIVTELAPPAVCRVVPDCRNAEPVDAVLAARFEFRSDPHATLARPAAVDPGPLDPAHPDHALYFQSRAAVFALDDSLGRAHDLSSERLAAALVPPARRAAMQRIDQVMLGPAGLAADRGTTAFALQGTADSPSARWASVATRQADATPLDESFRQLERLQREAIVQVSTPAPARQREAPAQTPPQLQHATP